MNIRKWEFKSENFFIPKFAAEQVESYCDVGIEKKIYSVLVVWLKRYKVVKSKDLCVSHFCSLCENL